MNAIAFMAIVVIVINFLSETYKYTLVKLFKSGVSEYPDLSKWECTY
ncbi:hypothetical protein [Fischerella sp. PCC 9605]